MIQKRTITLITTQIKLNHHYFSTNIKASTYQSSQDPFENELKTTKYEYEERKLTNSEKELLKPMLRVNQAGEIGANYIYMGQLAVFKKDPKLKPLIEHMWEQEKVHLDKFNQLISDYQVRPTALSPLWKIAGYALGMSTALMGKEAAMACTEAVETVIGEHYNDQLRDLAKIRTKEMDEIRQTIRQFRDDELEHLETAVEHDAQKAPFHQFLTSTIQTGCKAAIYIASRI